MSTASNYNLNAQQEHLHMKYVGCGHADVSKYVWLTNQHRDTYASYLGHHSFPMYYAVAKNETIGRTRYELVQKMIRPCGENPNKDESEE